MKRWLMSHPLLMPARCITEFCVAIRDGFVALTILRNKNGGIEVTVGRYPALRRQ